MGATVLVIFEQLLEGFLVYNVRLFLLTLLFGLPLGLLIAFGSMNRWAPLRALGRGDSPGRVRSALAAFCPLSFLTRIIVWVVRGTPLMLQIIIIFYVPGILWKNIWGPGYAGRFLACTIAFIINYACYFSEIYRGGIQSMPVGQREAGEVLGMTKLQIFFRITLLQVVKRIVPPMGNEIITLVKDTSLARVVAIMEIIMVAGEKAASGMIWPLFSTALFFLAAVGVLTLLLGWTERRLDYFR